MGELESVTLKEFLAQSVAATVVGGIAIFELVGGLSLIFVGLLLIKCVIVAIVGLVL